MLINILTEIIKLPKNGLEPLAKSYKDIILTN